MAIVIFYSKENIEKIALFCCIHSMHVSSQIFSTVVFMQLGHDNSSHFLTDCPCALYDFTVTHVAKSPHDTAQPCLNTHLLIIHRPEGLQSQPVFPDPICIDVVILGTESTAAAASEWFWFLRREGKTGSRCASTNRASITSREAERWKHMWAVSGYSNSGHESWTYLYEQISHKYYLKHICK